MKPNINNIILLYDIKYRHKKYNHTKESRTTQKHRVTQNTKSDTLILWISLLGSEILSLCFLSVCMLLTIKIIGHYIPYIC